VSVKKGTIRVYNAGPHTADVQVEGSLGVWLTGVPVAANIDAATVVVGRRCAVELFDEGNPTDVVITAVFPGGPSH
jgi:hypothetical protein